MTIVFLTKLREMFNALMLALVILTASRHSFAGESYYGDLRLKNALVLRDSRGEECVVQEGRAKARLERTGFLGIPSVLFSDERVLKLNVGNEQYRLQISRETFYGLSDFQAESSVSGQPMDLRGAIKTRIARVHELERQTASCSYACMKLGITMGPNNLPTSSLQPTLCSGSQELIARRRDFETRMTIEFFEARRERSLGIFETEARTFSDLEVTETLSACR